MSAGLAFAKVFFGAKEKIRRIKGKIMDTKTAPAGTIYGFEAKLNDGTVKKLADYKGLVLLVINVASECGFTSQYGDLEDLYKQYKDRGFRILAFPANDFGAQEPGTDEQIRAFCTSRYGVTFDLFSKIAVKGEGAHPLYRFLTTESGQNGPIPWNFSKFLVARDGRVAHRFGPETDPVALELTEAVESLLKEGR